MQTTIKSITTNALTLPQKSRALLANILLDTLDKAVEPIDNDHAWIKEAKRRDKEMNSGKSSCKSHKEVMNAAYEAIGCKK
jgi:hypothetical protein